MRWGDLSDRPLLIGAIVGVGLLGWSHRVAQRRKRNPRGLPLPPGPKGLPIFGNYFQMPKAHPWVHFAEWTKEYGAFLGVSRETGQPIVVLGDLPPAVDLLEKWFANYSNRPNSAETLKFLDLSFSLALMNYGPTWRIHRRTFHQSYNQISIPLYEPIVAEETRACLRRFLARPENFVDDLQRLFSLMFTRISYGSDDDAFNDGVIQKSDRIASGLAEVVTPGKYLVNSFPWLRWVPKWFPGAGWKHRLEAWSEALQVSLNEPFEDVLERQSTTAETPSFKGIARDLLDRLTPPDDPSYVEKEFIARGTLLVAYLGGNRPLAAAGRALVLALAKYPEVQRRAREEVDALLGGGGGEGGGGLPSFEDVSKLVYVQALVKEVVRWHNVSPLGLPRVTAVDDEYEGYFIPKGTMVIPNVWAMTHDPARFEDPFDVKPERFLKDGQLWTRGEDGQGDLDRIAFGFGRRICPGMRFSQTVLVYLVASILSVFELAPAKDEFGAEVPLRLEVDSTTLSMPKPFKCEIVPRSERHVALLVD